MEKRMRRGPQRQRDTRVPKAAASVEIIYGMHAALAVLENPRRTVHRVTVTENALARVKSALEGRGIAPQVLPPRRFDEMLGEGAVHQGIAVEAAPLDQPGLETLLGGLSGKTAPVLAMLDQVTDPHNVGAVLRSAAAFSVAGLIVQARHGPTSGGVLAKAASGGLEHVPLVEVVNLSRSLDAAKEHGYTCIGFDSDATASLDEALIGASRVLLVFGAEDKGLRRLVRETCDMVCALPVTGPIRSLNVSNAAAIAFYETSRWQGSLRRRAP